MRVRKWELAGAGLGVFVAASYVLTGQAAIAVGFVIASVLWFLSRARPLQAAGVAAAHPLTEARRHLLIVIALSVGVVIVAGLLVASAVDGWAASRGGVVAVAALAALEASLLVHLRHHLEVESRWRVGADAELAVAASLDELAREGWLVYHNWPKPEGGNVDHVVAGPRGVFAIETKHGRYPSSAYSQAIGAAMAVKRRCDARFVRAVVCVSVADEPYTKRRDVHVVTRDHLVDWLRRQPLELAPTERIAAALRAAEPAASGA